MPTAGEYDHYKKTRRMRDEDPYRSRDRYLEHEDIVKKPRQMNGLIHFCKPDSMSTCRAKDSTDRQRYCEFFLPASSCSRCMDLRFDEYCTNQVLHQYIAGNISDDLAKVLVKEQKTNLAKIQNRAEGYHIVFPLEGEETIEDLQSIYEQLCNLGMITPEFWMDQNGREAEQASFSISIEDVKAGKWCPKKKGLKKDILKYFELKAKLGV